MKKISKYILVLLSLCLVGWHINKVESILSKSAQIYDVSERISYISSRFLDTPYQAGTMKGNPDEKEELVIKLNGMDCFTFLDYVEALRLSKDANEFTANLKRVRYFGSEVAYNKRKHFFTDWVSGENNSVKDITPNLPGSVTVEKFINRKSSDKNWLKNLPQKKRMVTYMPAKLVDKDVIKLLKSGDYIGIYTDKNGLDVIHTGIFIRDGKKEFFRNTSSKVMKVTDYSFKEYMEDVKGIIVFRPKQG